MYKTIVVVVASEYRCAALCSVSMAINSLRDLKEEKNMLFVIIT